MKKLVASSIFVLLMISAIGCAPIGSGYTSQSEINPTSTQTVLPTTKPNLRELPQILTPVPETYTNTPYTEITEDLIFYSPVLAYSDVGIGTTEKASVPFSEPADRAQVIGISDGLEVYIALENGDPEAERRVRVASWSISTETWTDLLEITVSADRNYVVDLVSEQYVVWYTSEIRGLEQMNPEICIYDRHTENIHRFKFPGFEDADYPMN